MYMLKKVCHYGLSLQSTVFPEVSSLKTREVLHAYGERGRRLQQALLGERSEVSPIHESYRGW